MHIIFIISREIDPFWPQILEVDLFIKRSIFPLTDQRFWIYDYEQIRHQNSSFRDPELIYLIYMRYKCDQIGSTYIRIWHLIRYYLSVLSSSVNISIKSVIIRMNNAANAKWFMLSSGRFKFLTSAQHWPQRE